MKTHRRKRIYKWWVFHMKILLNRRVCACMYVWMDGWMYACMHVCMYACMHVCMYACMHVCIYACMHVCMYACMHVCMYACMHVCMYACMHACMYVCMHMHACMYVCMYVVDTFQTRNHLSFEWRSIFFWTDLLAPPAKQKNDAWFGFDGFCLEISLNFKGVSQK